MENKYKVTINGIDYYVISERSEEFIAQIEAYVNSKITAIIDANPKVSLSNAAIYAALNAAEDLVAEKEAADLIRTQVTGYSKEAYDNEEKMYEYKEKYERALKEIERLRNGKI